MLYSLLANPNCRVSKMLCLNTLLNFREKLRVTIYTCFFRLDSRSTFEILVKSNTVVNILTGGIRNTSGSGRVIENDNQQDHTTRSTKTAITTTTQTPSSTYNGSRRVCLLFISVIIFPVTSGWVATWLSVLTWKIGGLSGTGLADSGLPT